MTRLQAKSFKEVMRLFVQIMLGEMSVMISKGISFMLGLKEESRWINLVQPTVEDERLQLCNHIVARGM